MPAHGATPSLELIASATAACQRLCAAQLEAGLTLTHATPGAAPHTHANLAGTDAAACLILPLLVILLVWPSGPADEPVLLLPPEYELVDQPSALKKIAELLHLAKQRGSRVQALTFAIKGPSKVPSLV